MEFPHFEWISEVYFNQQKQVLLEEKLLQYEKMDKWKFEAVKTLQLQL